MSTNLRKTPEWLATHRATIGGSNAAAAVGMHPYKTPVSLYYEMVMGQADDLETNPDALRGILLEPVARQRLSDVLGMDIIEHNQNDFIRNERYPWAHCLPDGWIVFEGERIPIEIKVPTPENWRRLDVAIADYIQCQSVHNSAVIESPALMLACLNPVTMEIYRQLYEPHQIAIDTLMESEQSFYDMYIIPRIPPPPQTLNDLKLRWPEALAGSRAYATAEIEHDMHALVGAKLQEKEAKATIEDISLRVKTFMEESEALVSEGGRVLATWKSHIVNALETKRFKEERPEVWAEYSADKPIRTFLVKKPKGSRL